MKRIDIKAALRTCKLVT